MFVHLAAPIANGFALSDATITRDRILDTAEALFAERGLAATPVRDIAAAVGLTPASLYNHFSGKEALYAAVLERGVRPLVDVLESLAGLKEPDSAIPLVVGHLAKRPNVARLIYHEAVTGGAHLVPLARTWIRPMMARALDAMKREVASPWDEADYRRVVAMWVQLIVGHFAVAPLVEELIGEDPLAPETVERQTAFLRKLSRLVSGNDA
jgi:AcrR family transcriptional regulator